MKSEICIKYKKTKSRPRVGFPLQKPLMRQWPWILKNGPTIKKSGFFT